jgi:hypothetical protein
MRKKCIKIPGTIGEKNSSKIKNGFFNKKKSKYFKNNNYNNQSPRFTIECKENHIVKLENLKLQNKELDKKINFGFENIINSHELEGDLINLKELKENVLNFKENAELFFNPFSYQEDIDKAAVLLNNNKKEYSKNYKNFSENKSSTSLFFYKRNINTSKNIRNISNNKNNNNFNNNNNLNLNSEECKILNKKLANKNINENFNSNFNSNSNLNMVYKSKNNLDWKIDNDKARKKVAYSLLKNKEDRFKVTNLYNNKKRNLNDSLENQRNKKIKKYMDIFNKDLKEMDKNLLRRNSINDSSNIEKDFQSQFNGEINNPYYNEIESQYFIDKEKFLMKNTAEFFNKNPSNKIMVQFASKKGNSNIKDFQPLSNIMTKWVNNSQKDIEFNTGKYNLPLYHEKIKMEKLNKY